MKQCKFFKFFLIVSFAVTLLSFLTLTANAQDPWYWTPNLIVPDQASKAAPGLAVFNGQLHMTHPSSRSNNMYHSYYDGILWTEDSRISSHSSSVAPSLAVYDGELHMVHLDSKSTSIYHSTYDGNSWSSRVKVLNYSSGTSPVVATFDGQLHMLHKSDTSTGIYHATYNGTSWTDHGIITGHSTQAAPALAVYGGYLHMVHLGSAANDLWHSFYNGISWSSNVQVLSYTTQLSPALAECNGELHMVHKGETTTDIYHSSYNGTSWTDRGIIPNQATSISPAIAAYNGPMHIIHPEAGSTDLYESFYLAQTCAVPAYQPDFWNFYTDILRRNNCYNYSNNKRTDTFAQPGKASGQMYTALTCPEVENGAISDGLTPFAGSCPSGENKIALVVAPDFDYHWYRMDTNGLWSHKPGGTNATNLDNSGNIITDPETADRGNYTDFCGYFCTCSDDIQGIGHEVIRSAPAAEAAVEEAVNGLKVTVMLYSGRPNPTFLVTAADNGKKEAIMQFFAAMETDCDFEEATVIPSLLGYNGISVEKLGEVKSFPYDRLTIYKENIETYAGKAEGKQFMRDGGRHLEEFLIQLAVEKGAVSKEMLKYIN